MQQGAAWHKEVYPYQQASEKAHKQDERKVFPTDGPDEPDDRDAAAVE